MKKDILPRVLKVVFGEECRGCKESGMTCVDNGMFGQTTVYKIDGRPVFVNRDGINGCDVNLGITTPEEITARVRAVAKLGR